jgi:uncharacterized protein
MARTPRTIDEYLATLDAAERAELSRLRSLIRAVAPRAEECIAYGVPSFRLDGQFFVGFGASAKHLSFYPGSAPIEAHRKELGRYSTSRGTIRFQAAKPLSATLVRKLLKARLTAVARKGRKATRRVASPRPAPPKHVPTPGLEGWITHTDLVSRDPAATRAWCEKVLGWKFGMTLPGPGGEYHLFAYSDKGGGGIHLGNPPEEPGSVPFVHVADARAAFRKALRAGAEVVSPPQRVMEGVTVAQVKAPGDVRIGLSGR